MYSYSKFHHLSRTHLYRHFLRPWILILFLGPLTACAQQNSVDQQSGSAEVKAISESLNERLKPARDCLAPDVEQNSGGDPDTACALQVLSSIRMQDLPSYERAEIWNLYGYTYYLLENLEQSLEYYERVVGEPGANAPLRNRTLKTVAQLNMVLERFEPALDYYQQWLDQQEVLEAKDHALTATIYYNLDQKEAALEYIEKAITMSESQGQLGKENWYNMQRSIYYNMQDCVRALEIVRKLYEVYPSERYAREIEGLGRVVEDDCNPDSYAVDGDPVLMVRVEPRYPAGARARDIEGYVDIEFDISKSGKTENLRIYGYEPDGIFNAQVLEAVAKWRYRPKIVDGQPVAVYGVTERLQFEM